MRVDGLADIFRVATHFDGERQLADQIAGVGADDTAADDAMGLFIHEDLGKAFVAAIGNGATGGGPREPGLADRPTLLFGFVLRHAHPGDFGVGVRDRGGYAAGSEVHGRREAPRLIRQQEH